jgi:type I restriction enzyme, R subunit
MESTAAEADGAYITTKEAATLALAIKIDETVKYVRLDDWRGNQAKEQQIKAALYGILQNVDEVERIFLIIQQQLEY